MKNIFTKKALWIAVIVFGVLIAGSLTAFFIWSQQTYSAAAVPQLELEEVQESDDGWYRYTAEGADKGIILYPGAKVEPEAYGYLAQDLSERGITVAIPSVRLNFAIFDVSKATEVIEKDPSIEWYVGGHSLGGAAAAIYADKELDKVSGLILLGAYASGNDELHASTLPVLSISGSKDGLSTPEKIEEYRPNLPRSTTFVEIPGGNHAYFGVYGSQSGDNDADITVAEQQAIIVDSIVEWLDEGQMTGEE